MKVLVTGAKGFVAKIFVHNSIISRLVRQSVMKTLSLVRFMSTTSTLLLSNLTHGVKIVILSSILLVSTVHKTQRSLWKVISALLPSS